MAFYQGTSKEALRAMQLTKRRQQQQEDIEIKKKKIEEDSKMTSIDNKFQQHYDAVEQLLRTDTIGLVTLEDMKKKQEKMVEQRQQQLALERRAKLDEENERKEKKERQKNQVQKLSFADEWEEENEDESEESSKEEADDEIKSFKKAEKKTKDESSDDLKDEGDKNQDDEEESPLRLFKKRFGKNPNVDTSFLPDKERQMEEDILREKLRKDWCESQEKLKNEEIEIVFSYWDGSGHRRTTRIRKGNTIQQFLYKCLDLLRKENQFNELKVTSVDQLIYVKEDIILPHHYTFYDLIVTKARGKSGPLFIFDCHDDIRITNDATVEKEESHAGKVILRSWYERHKHIFPASRWEPYDPEKKWDTPYTVKDKN